MRNPFKRNRRSNPFIPAETIIVDSASPELQKFIDEIEKNTANTANTAN